LRPKKRFFSSAFVLIVLTKTDTSFATCRNIIAILWGQLDEFVLTPHSVPHGCYIISVWPNTPSHGVIATTLGI